MLQKCYHAIGYALAIGGACVSTAGILVNNFYLDHHTAMLLWAVSNPLLMVWAIGVYTKKWNSGLGAEVVAVMYFIALVSGLYGLFWPDVLQFISAYSGAVV